MKTPKTITKGTKRWMPLAVIAASGCFIGAEASAQSSQNQQQTSSAQSQQSKAKSEKSIKDALQKEGVEQQRVDQLSQDGFDRQEIEIALIAVYEREGMDEQQARQEAGRVAERITGQKSQRQQSQSQQGEQNQSGQQSWAQQAAPQGADVQDSATMVLNEEELEVQKREVPVGGIVLRKKVTTDNANETVQLRSEDIEIVRLSPEEAQKRQSQQYESSFDQPFQEGEIFIPLMREEATANKEVQTREVVRAQPQVQTEQKQFDATLRQEEVEVQRVDAQRSQQQAQNQSSQNQQSDEEQFSARQQFDDLKSQIRSELSNADIGLNDQQIEQIEIEVEENTVTLSGNVPDEQAKQQIEQLVQGIPQVQDVQNDLETKE